MGKLFTEYGGDRKGWYQYVYGKEDIRKTMQQVGIKSDCLRRPILHNRRSFGFDCPPLFIVLIRIKRHCNEIEMAVSGLRQI